MATRSDPYRNFRFRVLFEGRPVAGVHKVSGLAWTADIVEMRDGTTPDETRKLPGPRKYDSVTLERGITQDVEFEQWAGQGPARTARREIDLQLLDPGGSVVRAWRLHRAWISRYSALLEIDASEEFVALEALTIEHEGWERTA